MAREKQTAPKNMDGEWEAGLDEENQTSTSDDWVSVNQCSAEMKKYIGIEARLDTRYLLNNDFIGLALCRAGLIDMMKGVPEEIYPVTVFEFLGYLNSETLTMMVTCDNPKTRHRYYRTINLLEFAEKALKLRNEGEDVMSAGNEVGIAELRRYTTNPDESWEGDEVKKFTRHLKTPFKDLVDLITKVMLCHTSNISTITNPKLRIMAALTDELQKRKQYNWARFMVNQWEDAAKRVRTQENNPYVILLRPKKTRFSSVLSFGVGATYKDLLKNPSLESRKTGLFNKNIDKTDVDVPDAMVKDGEEEMFAIVRRKVDADKELRTKKAEKQKEAEQRKATKAAPQKKKKLVSLATISKARKQIAFRSE